MSNKSIEKVYEVGFHLIPTMDADGVSKAFERVKQVVSDKGSVLSEEHPVLRDLAYTIRHTVRQHDGSYNRYTEAYFGSIKFSSPRDAVKQVEKMLLDDEEVLRFLLIETSTEDTRVGEVLPGDKEKEEKEEKEERRKKEGKREREEKKRTVADASKGTPSSGTKGKDEKGESGVAEQTEKGDAPDTKGKGEEGESGVAEQPEKGDAPDTGGQGESGVAEQSEKGDGEE